MSTIDIGIAELPAQTVVQTALTAQPTRHMPTRKRVTAAVPQVSVSMDFYVGSVKLDAMPTNAHTVQTRLPEPVC
jgi:hypothetical protein